MSLRMLLALACVTSMSVSTVCSTAQAQPPTDAASPNTTSENDAGGDGAAPDAASDDDAAQNTHEPDQQQVSALLDQEARGRFQLGSTLYRQGRLDDAEREFRAAYEVSHRAELLYNLYLVARDAGHTREAAEALRTYLQDAEQVPDRGLMESRLAGLDRQIAAAQPQQPNTRVQETGGIDESEPAESSPTIVEEPAEESPEADEPNIVPTGPAAESPSLVLPISLLTGGGAVLALGAAFALLAKNKHEQLDYECTWDSLCYYAGAEQDINTLHRDALLADISFGLGGAAVAAGILVWILQSAPEPDAEEHMARVSGGCSADGCELSLEGSF